MSTRVSIIYDEQNGTHIYQELLDGWIYLEIIRPDVTIELRIMPFDKWRDAGMPFVGKLDVAELPQLKSEVVALKEKIAKYEGILSGDPDNTASPEDREAWRRSAINYATKLENEILSLLLYWDSRSIVHLDRVGEFLHSCRKIMKLDLDGNVDIKTYAKMRGVK